VLNGDPLHHNSRFFCSPQLGDAGSPLGTFLQEVAGKKVGLELPLGDDLGPLLFNAVTKFFKCDLLPRRFNWHPTAIVRFRHIVAHEIEVVLERLA
jgi:hypothetical protein